MKTVLEQCEEVASMLGKGLQRNKARSNPINCNEVADFHGKEAWLLLGSLGFAVVVKVLVVAKIISLPPKQDQKKQPYQKGQNFNIL